MGLVLCTCNSSAWKGKDQELTVFETKYLLGQCIQCETMSQKKKKKKTKQKRIQFYLYQCAKYVFDMMIEIEYG